MDDNVEMFWMRRNLRFPVKRFPPSRESVKSISAKTTRKFRSSVVIPRGFSFHYSARRVSHCWDDVRLRAYVRDTRKGGSTRSRILHHLHLASVYVSYLSNVSEPYKTTTKRKRMTHYLHHGSGIIWFSKSSSKGVPYIARVSLLYQFSTHPSWSTVNFRHFLPPFRSHGMFRSSSGVTDYHAKWRELVHMLPPFHRLTENMNPLRWL